MLRSDAFQLQIPVLIQDLLGHGGALVNKALGQFQIVHRQNLGCQHRGIGAAPHGHGGHGDSAGHLHSGEQGVQALQIGTGAGHADHRQGRIGGDGTGKMGSHPGKGDHAGEAAAPGGAGKFRRLTGRPMGGENMGLVGDFQLLEHVDSLFNHRKSQ